MSWFMILAKGYHELKLFLFSLILLTRGASKTYLVIFQ